MDTPEHRQLVRLVCLIKLLLWLLGFGGFRLLGNLRFLVIALGSSYVKLSRNGTAAMNTKSKTLEQIAVEQKARLERTMEKLAKKRKAEHDALARKFCSSFNSNTLKAWAMLTEFERSQAVEKISANIQRQATQHHPDATPPPDA